MSEKEVIRRDKNVALMTHIDAITQQWTGLENDMNNEQNYGNGQILAEDQPAIRNQQYNIAEMSTKLIRNRRDQSKQFLLSGNKDAFMSVPITSKAKYNSAIRTTKHSTNQTIFNSRSSSTNFVPAVNAYKGDLPAIETKESFANRHSIGKAVNQMTSENMEDDLISEDSFKAASMAQMAAQTHTNKMKSTIRPSTKPLNLGMAAGYKSMIGFAGNKDVGSYASSIQDTAHASKSLRYNPQNFVKFRRQTRPSPPPSIQEKIQEELSASKDLNNRRVGVITTLHANPDPVGDLYARSLKKLTQHYRKGVMHINGQMNTDVPTSMTNGMRNQ